MTRSLSSLEAKLILQLEWEKKSIVTIEDAMDILGCSYAHARKILQQLNDDRWLARIRSGTYELIPAERGEHAFLDTNPLFLGSTLVDPYYYSYATTAFYHGLSTQASNTVYIATTKRKGQQVLKVRGKSYRLVKQPAHKFFGALEKNAYGSTVKIADQEKTILDSLDRPSYSGDIPEITSMLQRGRNKLDWPKLIDYALRFETQALIQRLGYLADLLDLPLTAGQRKRLLEQVGNSTPYLGHTSRWGTGGSYDSTWRIMDNIPDQEKLAELEVW